MRRMGSSIAILVSLLTLVVVACTPAVPTAAPTPEPTSTTTPSPTATPTPIPPPVASFSMDVSSGTAPVNVQFSDTSQGPVTTWEWDFGDGSSSTAQNPSHEYTVAGSHTVQLTVSGPGESQTVALPEPIVITPGPLADVAVSPGAVSLQVQETARLVATGLDQFGNEISAVQLTWTVSAPLGSIDETGLLTAGTEAGTFEGLVKVTASTGGVEHEAFIDVTVSPGLLATVALEPAEVTMDLSGTQRFSFSGHDRFGNEIQGLTGSWELAQQVGFLDTADGTFTAASRAGTYPELVHVIVVGGPEITVDASADVTILPGPLATLELEQAGETVAPGATVDFTVMAYDDFRNRITGADIQWSATGGIVDAQGVFTAPDEPGLYEVTASASFKGGELVETIRVTVGTGTGLFLLVRYNGEPISDFLDGVPEVTLTLRSASTGEREKPLLLIYHGIVVPPAEVRWDDTAGLFVVSNVVPGEYSANTSIDSQGDGYPTPGDYTGSAGFFTVGEDTFAIAELNVSQYLRVTAPFDSETGIEDRTDIKSFPTGRLLFEWDPIPEATQYRVTVNETSDVWGGEIRSIVSESITTNSWLSDLPPNEPDQHYTFEVEAFNEANEPSAFLIGRSLVVFESGGWASDFSFKVDS